LALNIVKTTLFNMINICKKSEIELPNKRCRGIVTLTCQSKIRGHRGDPSGPEENPDYKRENAKLKKTAHCIAFR
jgi:hypothetical protein